MEGTILVTPEVLESTATEFNNVMIQLQNMTNTMVDQVNGLGAKWQGEASQAYINRFNQLQDDISTLTAKVNEHVKDLNEMAERFINTEQLNEERANTLAADIIV
ncbi:MAG: WXG100 family type VII secretion target [Lachnospiraceae bacterium]|nr:WXG100 family type VII secretion target [Lachnospiraceae bacterium]